MKQQTLTPSQVRAHTARSAGERTLAAQLDRAGVAYQQEYRFAPPRRFRADFAIFRDGNDKPVLLVEVEGGVWTRGRHVRGSGYTADMEKYNLAAMTGYTVLRFTPRDVKDGTALAAIQAALDRPERAERTKEKNESI
jgi:very-short-patch-repair endonuclease